MECKVWSVKCGVRRSDAISNVLGFDGGLCEAAFAPLGLS